MMVNGDFTRVVEANFHERKRSSSAAKQDRAATSATIMLQQVGFHDVSNLLGGLRRHARSNRKNQRSGLGEFPAAGQ